MLRSKLLFGLLMSLFTLPCFSQAVIKVDSSFNTIGYSAVNVYSIQGGHKIIVNPTDQKYIIRGMANPYGAYIKYERDGQLDKSFNKSGALLQPNSEGYVAGFFIDNNGNLVNPVYKPTLEREMGFMRTLPSGIPDSSFGTNGVTYVNNASKGDGYFLPLSNGKFLMASTYFYTKNGVRQAGIKVQQFKSYYALDSSFGVNGAIVYELGLNSVYVRQVQVFDDGKILISTEALSLTPEGRYDYDALMVRSLPTGELDNSFGENGLVRPFARESLDDHFYGSCILPGKKIVACGFEDNQGFIARFQYDGKLDSSFGSFGYFSPNFSFITYSNNAMGNSLLPGFRVML